MACDIEGDSNLACATDSIVACATYRLDRLKRGVLRVQQGDHCLVFTAQTRDFPRAWLSQV